ncbi:MAG: apolipoprotein N-acyltransferase [Bacteroidetes bacterium]|nr:apolipoprotein N-acyltransferase [Bacteroidota bacterium]
MMEKKIKYWKFGMLASGLLGFIAICQINFFVSWIFYIPLFISINKATPKIAFKKGGLYGLTFSCFAFYWMIPGAERFTGQSMLYGIGAFLISLIFISLFYSLLLYCFSVLKKSEKQFRSVIINGCLIATIFCIGEAILMKVSIGFPWMDIHSGSGLAANLYSIQAVAFLGIHALTFVVVFVNYIAAYYILNRMYFKLYVPLIYIISFLTVGYILNNEFNNRKSSDKPIKIAVLAENIIPDIKWDDYNGNMLVQRLLDLNKIAAKLKPDMILWSESAIPWTYSKNDDLVKEVLTITNPAQATHIMGINTAYTNNQVYNSAYCILPDGSVTSRYDKQYLLALIEKPINGLIMPFLSSKGFIARDDKAKSAPLNTPYGKAGILICNEAAVPLAASKMVRQGAAFLLNMSNDGWFNDTYIVRLHFYYARLRAVESRKDLVINCNNGYSGLIKASGEIKEQMRSEDPFVKMVSIAPNNIISLASDFPDLFIYCCVAYLFLFIIFTKNPFNYFKMDKIKK